MWFMKEEQQNQHWVWMLYNDEQTYWTRKMTVYDLTYTRLDDVMRFNEIKWGIVEAMSPNIELLYWRIPDIHIMINPYSLMQYIKGLQEVPTTLEQEVAITLENQIKEETEDIQSFLTCFYKASGLEEAYGIYEEWQGCRLLHHPIGNKLIDFFQAYEEEIFNYFACPTIRQILKHKKYHS